VGDQTQSLCQIIFTSKAQEMFNMSNLGDLMNALKSLVQVNRTERESMRSIVTELSDQLTRILDTAISFANRATTISDTDELTKTLFDARADLLSSFMHNQICQPLFDLRDRLEKRLDIVKLTIEIGKVNQISSLLASLGEGRIITIDELDKFTQDCESMAKSLRDGETAILEIRKKLDDWVKSFDAQKRHIAKLPDEIFTTM
jgi:hypothetical protein